MESSDGEPPPPGFPFRKSKSKGKKPSIPNKAEAPPRPPVTASRTYRGETSSSSFFSRPPGESSSNPYLVDTSSIVCGGDASSPCCEGDASNSAPRFPDGEFPMGLRVLLVDDDQTCLTIVSQLLTECRYEVTCCNHPRLALSVLRERRGEIDVVITDVYMPEIDGFKLLELVAAEMDIPVVMMSVDCGVEVARRGIEKGACYYLMKPVSKEELRNVWQHVFLWKKNLPEQGGIAITQDNPQANNPEENPLPENPQPAIAFPNGEDGKPSKRSRQGKEAKEENINDDEINELGAHKKHRVIWSAELHSHFLKAVNQLGYDKAVPKKILELMNVPGITRENIASHLQKYRIFLRRLSSDPNMPLQPSPRQTLGTPGAKNWVIKHRGDHSGGRHCAWKVLTPDLFLPGFPQCIPPSSSNARTPNPNPNPTPPSNTQPPIQYTDPAGPSSSSSSSSSSSIMPENDFQQPLPEEAGQLEDFQQTPSSPPAFNQIMLPSPPPAFSQTMLPSPPPAFSQTMLPSPPPAFSQTMLPSPPPAFNQTMLPSPPPAFNQTMLPSPPPAFNQTMPPTDEMLQPNIEENPEIEMDLNLMAMSPQASSSFGVGPVPMVDQQQLLPPGPPATAPFGSYQGLQGVPGDGNNYHWQGIHMGSSPAPSMLNYSGLSPNNYTGLCMTSTGGLYGVTRTGSMFETSVSDNSIGSLFDEISRNGKRPIVEGDQDDFQFRDIHLTDFSDNDQEWVSFNESLNVNLTEPIYANTSQGDDEKVATTEKYLSDGNGTSLGESSLPLYSDDGDFPLHSDDGGFDDLFFQQVNHPYSYTQLEGLEFSFPDFDFSSFNLDDNPPAQ